MLRKGLFASLVLLATFVFAHTEEPVTEVESDVLSLVKDTFHDVVDPENLILVEFFAPWCGHCKALAPEYEQAATELKEKDIKLAKVDCTAETELCNKFEVKGYPTLKVFRNGNATDYTGGRKADLIVSYMKKQAQPAVSDVTAETLDTFKDSDNVVIIGFFSEDDQTEFNTFSDLGEEWRNTDFIFGVTGQKEAADKAEVKTPAIILYKKFDEGKNVHEGTFTKDQLVTFIRSNSVPVLAEITPENYAAYVDTGLPLAFLFYENDEQKKTFGKAIEPVASEHKGKVNFVYIDATKYGTHAQNINLKQEWPAFGIQKPEEELKYPFDQTKEITTESIKEFVNKFVNNEIQPSVKSEPIPEKNDDPVYVLVADNFEEVVYDAKKDVLVEFYAPWCGHCKKLAPTYDKLGEVYSAVKDKVLIAKIDATANDLPPRVPFKISGFPSIKLFKAGDKEIEDYQGDRSFESFIEFLDKHTVNKVEVNVTSPAAESEEAVPSAASSESAEASETVPVHPHEEL